MIAALRQGTALSRREPRRTLLAIVLLIGLFIMHGLPVLMALACPPDDAARSAHQVVRLAVTETAATADSRAGAAIQIATLESADCSGCDDCSAATDDSCVPLRLSSSTELLAALLLGLGAVLIPWASIAAFVGARVSRGGGTTRTGPSLLLKVCVCRT